MKHLLLSALLLTGLAGCKKDEPAAPFVLAAQLNGQSWESDARFAPFTSVTDSYAYNPVRYIFSVGGMSENGVPGLNLSRLDFRISFSYLPKIGRHPINTGSVNAKQNYCQAYVYFDAPDKGTYRAEAASGYVEITEIANGRIKGKFELTCPATNMPATSGAPAVLTFTQGQFDGLTDEPHNKTLTWDGAQ